MFLWNKFLYTNKIKTKHTTLSEQFQKFNRKMMETEVKLIHQANMYMTANYPGLAKGLQTKVAGLNVWE